MNEKQHFRVIFRAKDYSIFGMKQCCVATRLRTRIFQELGLLVLRHVTIRLRLLCRKMVAAFQSYALLFPSRM